MLQTLAWAAIPALLLMACASKETNLSSTADGSNAESGTPELTLSTDSLQIIIPDTVESPFVPGNTYSGIFSITNDGDGVLQLYNVDIADSADGALDMSDGDDLAVAPNSDKEFTVVVVLDEATQVEGLIRIKSNATDYLDYRLPVVACVESACLGEDGGGDDGGDDGDDTGDEE